MEIKACDLRDMLCPFCVVRIIREVDKMQPGDILGFRVDDPLAIKAVPVELDEYDNLHYTIQKQSKSWLITVSKS